MMKKMEKPTHKNRLNMPRIKENDIGNDNLHAKRCSFCTNLFIPRYRNSQRFCDKICQEKFWVLKNKEHLKDYKNEWYNKNRRLTIRRAKKWATKNPIKTRESSRKSFLNNKDKYNKRNKRYKLNNPEKKKAQSKAQYFITIKPACEICGSTRNLLRHHWRYDKPLMVNTLCRSCHAIQHIKKFDEVIYNEI